jgi:hypothetical protein
VPCDHDYFFLGQPQIFRQIVFDFRESHLLHLIHHTFPAIRRLPPS